MERRAAARVASDGSFTLKHVPPGSYTVGVETGRTSARQRIEVKDVVHETVIAWDENVADASGATAVITEDDGALA